MRAQDVRKRYTSLVTERGTLYFVYPRELKAAGPGPGARQMPLDMTYLTSSDSVVFTVTLRIPSAGSPATVNVVRAGSEPVSASLERIYVDSRRSVYEHRLRFGLPFDCAYALYASGAPYVLRFETPGGVCAYAFTDSGWKKEKAVMERIFELFRINRPAF